MPHRAEHRAPSPRHPAGTAVAADGVCANTADDGPTLVSRAEWAPARLSGPYPGSRAHPHPRVSAYRSEGLGVAGCMVIDHESRRRHTTFVTRTFTVAAPRVTATGKVRTLPECVEGVPCRAGIADARCEHIAADPRLLRSGDAPPVVGDLTGLRRARGWTPTAVLAEVAGRVVGHELGRWRRANDYP